MRQVGSLQGLSKIIFVQIGVDLVIVNTNNITIIWYPVIIKSITVISIIKYRIFPHLHELQAAKLVLFQRHNYS